MFIDANIFIHAALGRDKKAEECRNFLKKVESGEQNSHTSVLVLEEALKAISHFRGESPSVEVINRFLRIKNLTVLALAKEDLECSFEFFKKSLDVHDSLHLAIMKKQGITTILSYDKDFDSIKGIKRVEP